MPYLSTKWVQKVLFLVFFTFYSSKSASFLILKSSGWERMYFLMASSCLRCHSYTSSMSEVLYSKYELLFLRMSYKEENNKKIRIKHRIAVLWSCRISVRRVLLFQREYMFKMYVKMQDTEFKKLIQEFRRACKWSNINE